MKPNRETGPSIETTEVRQRQHKITLSVDKAHQVLIDHARQHLGLDPWAKNLTTVCEGKWNDSTYEYVITIIEALPIIYPIPDDAPQDPSAFRLIEAAPRKLSEPTSFEVHEKPTITVDDVMRYREAIPRWDGVVPAYPHNT